MKKERKREKGNKQCHGNENTQLQSHKNAWLQSCDTVTVMKIHCYKVKLKKIAQLSRTVAQYTKVKNFQNVFPIKQNNKVLYILNTNSYF